MTRRDELIELCWHEPEKMADLILALEARVGSSLEQRLNNNSKNSHQPPSSEGLKKPPRQRAKKSKRKPGGQKGHVGQTFKFSPNPDQIIQHGAKQCQRSGESLVEVAGAVIARCQEIELPEKSVQVIEHQRLQKRCPCCGQSNQGEWPAHLTGNVQYRRCFKALCLYLIVYQFLPCHCTAELLETLFGYQPGEGDLKRLPDQAYAALEQIESTIKVAICGSPVVHGDETSIQVEGQTRWLHVVSTVAYTYYYWSQYRGQKAHRADGLLAEYESILMHNAYQAYFGHRYLHALCNTHLWRELQAIYEADSNQRWSRNLSRLLRIAWAWVKRVKATGETQLPFVAQERIWPCSTKLWLRRISKTHHFNETTSSVLCLEFPQIGQAIWKKGPLCSPGYSIGTAGNCNGSEVCSSSVTLKGLWLKTLTGVDFPTGLKCILSLSKDRLEATSSLSKIR